MNQELSTTANLWRLVIPPVISGAVICVIAAAGLNTEATPNDLPTEENESTSVIIVERRMMLGNL